MVRKKNQKNTIYTSEDNLPEIEIREITDSRCPTGVVCVWEGEVKVKINTFSGNSGEITFSTHNHLLDTLDIWTFRLLDVIPYPVYQQPVRGEKIFTVMIVDKLKN